ncbi:hypothetical protein U27_04413 [Candidatus Vecturithrix granuli]|uniref:DUF3782 domain-containing protein n=1 Tax=Vecturithrix granuli TaxID=1499967 RepID=A0A081BYP1_VECG1|nr:hypothetical protein U27_04413 [Candidatus Vecturithrix granuli]
MITTDIKQWIRRELPVIFREDVEIHQFILDLTRSQYADKQVTESRFDRILDELQRDREEHRRKWDEQNRKWDEQNRKWDEQNRKWDEQNRKWDEHLQVEKQEREEQKRKWDENQQTIKEMLARIDAQQQKHDSSIGALGARWGLQTEEAFRNALAAILERSFGVQVVNVTEFDDTGEVFGHPDQVELDVIIHNGTLILCEIKSSMSRSDVYTFDRKVKFYERLHNCTANRRIIITPMIREDGRRTAEKLNLEVYSYAQDVKPFYSN